MHVLPVHVYVPPRLRRQFRQTYQRMHVFDGEEGEDIYDLIKPLGKHYSTDCELEIDMLHSESARAYEIRSAGDPLKTLRFPTIITTTVQCA